MDSDSFRIGPDAGGMPVPGARGHAALATVWREPDAGADARVRLAAIREKRAPQCGGGRP
jgi:hypothetical protein